MKTLLIASTAVALAALASPASAAWCDGINDTHLGPAIKVDAKACAAAPRTGTVGYVLVDERHPAKNGFRAPRDLRTASDRNASDFQMVGVGQGE